MLVEKIPEALIYEVSDGKPIYHRGYRDVLEKRKKLEDIMGCSSLQSLLVSRIIRLLNRNLDDNLWEAFTNEVGLQIKKGKRQACDIALFLKKDLESYPFNNKLFSISPKIVIEVDSKADMEDMPSPMDYYFKKTEELLGFGVEKLIWITTDSQKVTIAEPGQDWVTKDWDTQVEILPGLSFNIQDLVN